MSYASNYPHFAVASKAKNLQFTTYKNIRGPKPFIRCLKHDQWLEVKKGIDALIAKEIYQWKAPKYYWYRVITKHFVFEGFICGVPLK